MVPPVETETYLYYAYIVCNRWEPYGTQPKHRVLLDGPATAHQRAGFVRVWVQI